jgi:hypothetical protein
MQIQVRNPQHNAVGTIDMEIEHPAYGWIPFTASPDDTEQMGRELYAQAAAGDFGPVVEYVAPPAPPEPPTPPEPRSVTPLQFFERFTADEQIAIVTATLTDPVVKLWYDKLLAAQEVVFADPRLSAGLDGMVAAGLITAERKTEILPEAQTSGVTVL